MMQHDVLLILKSIYPSGLGMFCQGICESWNCILEKLSNHHTNRDGGPGLTIKRESHVVTRVLECTFMYIDSHIVANGYYRSGGCTNGQLYEEWDPTSDIVGDVISADVTMTPL